MTEEQSLNKYFAPILCAELVSDVLLAWDVEISGPIEEVVAGDVFRIPNAGGEAWILKNVGNRQEQTIRQVTFEREVLLHVHQAGLPVPVPRLDRQGRIAVPWRDQYYTLSPCLPSSQEELTGPIRAQLFRNYGRTIARMHRVLAAFPQDGLARRTWRTDLESEVFEIGIPIIMPHLQGRQAEWFGTMMEDRGQAMKDAFQDLPEQLIHRDCHMGNLLSCGTEVTGIIDWDHLSLGPRILDLAYFAVQIAKRQIHQPDKMAQWLDEIPLLLQGYDSKSALLVKEKAAFPYVLIAVPIFFTYWLIETGQISSVQIELDAVAWLHNNLDLIRDLNRDETFSAQ